MTSDDLTRRAIIAAHDAECPCAQWRGDDATTYPPLTKREQAIAALWRADVETTSVVHECCEARQSAEGALCDVRAWCHEWSAEQWVARAVLDRIGWPDGTETTP